MKTKVKEYSFRELAAKNETGERVQRMLALRDVNLAIKNQRRSLRIAPKRLPQTGGSSGSGYQNAGAVAPRIYQNAGPISHGIANPINASVINPFESILEAEDGVLHTPNESIPAYIEDVTDHGSDLLSEHLKQATNQSQKSEDSRRSVRSSLNDVHEQMEVIMPIEFHNIGTPLASAADKPMRCKRQKCQGY